MLCIVLGFHTWCYMTGTPIYLIVLDYTLGVVGH